MVTHDVPRDWNLAVRNVVVIWNLMRFVMRYHGISRSHVRNHIISQWTGQVLQYNLQFSFSYTVLAYRFECDVAYNCANSRINKFSEVSAVFICFKLHVLSSFCDSSSTHTIHTSPPLFLQLQHFQQAVLTSNQATSTGFRACTASDSNTC